MKICNGDVVIANIPLDIAALQKPESSCLFDDFIMLEYRSNVLRKCVKSLILDVAEITQPVWKYPDYDSARMYICLSGDDETDLSLEVFPRKYTPIEERHILTRASHEVFGSGFSEYEDLREIIEASKAFYRQSEKSGVIWTYELQLAENEICDLKRYITIPQR